jgi:hypothetical protein
LYQMPVAGLDPRAAYEDWLSRFGADWLAFDAGGYAWGGIALTALVMGDKAVAHCWRSRAEALRETAHWDIVEEAAYQRVWLSENILFRPKCEGMPRKRNVLVAPVAVGGMGE